MSVLHALCWRFWPAIRTVGVDLPLSVSNRSYEDFPAAVKSAVVLTMTVNIASNMHANAFHCIAQHNLA